MSSPDDPHESSPLAAGDFGRWIAQLPGALRGEHASDVPCGTCTACCTSSQFVHIGPDELDALAHIPAALRFPAPGRPKGHQVMGYDARGHCPMLVDGACSIYEHRPQTCRTYDCRVFPASGLEVDGDTKVAIRDRARRWQFSYTAIADEQRQAAVRAAATYLRGHPDLLPGTTLPTDPTQLAVLAAEVHSVFLAVGPTSGEPIVIDPSSEAVRDAILRAGARRAGL
jgi:Fe-S-cluster containining protein